ncbi:MAG: heme ABC transporter ATP-binding protein [Patiriisocius sp.]|uniref:heme ABC transporter ATP-binding protein n=1 Tax=Patiriisocius sp. TaxID=2822396 RepID=UPI003EF9EAEB
MIRVQSLTYKIGNKPILNDVNVTFRPGELNLIIGPNGAGKSTLVKAICNQIKPHVGTVFYGNETIKQKSNLELAKIRAVLSQNVDIAFPLKVKEVVMMGRYPHFSVKPTKKDEEACKQAMEFFDVLDMSEREYPTLSGGEKQRVHFARVVSQLWFPVEGQCRYLILDEPLTFLDTYYQFQFMHKIVELLKSKHIVVVGVVHDLNLAAKFADHIVLIKNGKVIASGDKHEVLSVKNIKEAYGLQPVIHKDKDSFFMFFE